MRNFKYIWAVGLVFTALVIVIPVMMLTSDEAETADDPWGYVPKDGTHTDHSALIKGALETGSDVTEVCLSCHEDAAQDVMHTTHWTWKSDLVEVAWRDEPVATGKANVLNNFCIGIQSNWTGCTKCHAGYGWSDASFDFSEQNNVDCLVCHEQTGTYVKDASGIPTEGVDLVSVAQSVAMPTRANCGYCHFNGGGGDAVKHGDLDTSLTYPKEHVDVHMGKYDLQCTDCHKTDDHQIKGRAISVSVDDANQVYCTDCHAEDLHQDARINAHVDTVACQTCHIPLGAVREPTKMVWDWSTAGQDREEDAHLYLKIKGSFIYEEDFMPEYGWHNGNVERYLFGDPVDPDTPTVLNKPLGSINDPVSKIWPFKIHRANQIYDAVYNYLIQPQTVGEEGYWTTFDWDSAARLGSEAVGLDYSGEYGFAPTEMYWTLSHMVAPADHALQCNSCHGDDGRMDWEALGYYGDPIRWGGRETK
jgi:octaheme c-type cytochrome (tetrathionate reductase family)